MVSGVTEVMIIEIVLLEEIVLAFQFQRVSPVLVGR